MAKVTKSRGSRRSPRRRSRGHSAKVEAPRVGFDTQPRAIMVLGMHRSGTSALTRVISLLGADLPHGLLPPTQTNEAGLLGIE